MNNTDKVYFIFVMVFIMAQTTMVALMLSGIDTKLNDIRTINSEMRDTANMQYDLDEQYNFNQSMLESEGLFPVNINGR